jgi:hypothetical protein
MDLLDETNLRIADAILEAAGDAIIACDAGGIIRFRNLGASGIWDSTRGVGRSLDIIILERLRTRHWRGFNKMVATGQARYPEGHPCRRPGTVKMDRKSPSNSRPVRLRTVAEL